MMRALSTAATGMQAQQLNVDTIANNLANVNTAAFKKTSVRFQDLLYQDLRPAGDPARLGPPSELAIGHGTKLAATERAFGPLSEALQRCVAEGVVDRRDVPDTLLTAWTLVHGLVMLWQSKHLAGRVQPADPRVLGRRVTELFTGLLAR